MRETMLIQQSTEVLKKLSFQYEALKKKTTQLFNGNLEKKGTEEIEEQDNNTVIIRREEICDGCKKDAPNPVEKPTDEITLLEFLDGLSDAEQRAVFVHLMTKWTDLLGGDKNA